MSSATVLVRMIRHGEVAAEHRATFYGGADVPLSAAGRAATLALAGTLADDPADRVVTSPLARARLLGESLAEAWGAPLATDARLVELDRGDWTHVGRDALEARDPGAIARYLEDPERHHAPGGEPESALCARVWAVLDEVVAFAGRAAAPPRVVLTCHGHVIRCAMRRYTGLDAAASLQTFVPYLGMVDLALSADGSGRVLAAPDPELPEALRRS